jgi:nucleoid DNA-binding protein
MKKLKEGDLVRQISSESGITMITTKRVLNSLKDVIIDNLRNGNQVHLIGFGLFEPFIRHERKGVDLSRSFNPITLPKIRIAKFRTGYKMKRMLKKD